MARQFAARSVSRSMRSPTLYALSPHAPGDAPIRILLADDHDFLRRSLRMLLEGETGFDVVGEADDIPTVLEGVQAQHPQVLVFDVSMADGPGLAALRRLREAAPDTAIVVTTMRDDPFFARDAIAAGASGYVLKEHSDEDLPEAIRRVARGESFVTPAMAAELSTYAHERTDPLSERELDVLRLIALGHTNPETAGLLGISSRTVETHRARIHRKLGLATRAELVRYALRRGLLGVAPGTKPRLPSNAPGEGSEPAASSPRGTSRV